MSESIEDRIKAEFGAVQAWVALHPYWAVGIAAVVGFIVGKL